jgi:putative ABC transport system permease protein
VLGASTRDLRGNSILIAAVALFVGGFLVFNTLSMTVSEWTREIGLLRAAGATPTQVDLVFLREALLLAALGTGAGG